MFSNAHLLLAVKCVSDSSIVGDCVLPLHPIVNSSQGPEFSFSCDIISLGELTGQLR